MEAATPEHFDACLVPQWPTALQRLAIPATVIPVEKPFLDYLLADSVFLPASGSVAATTTSSNGDGYDGDDGYGNGNSVSDNDDNSSNSSSNERQQCIPPHIRSHLDDVVVPAIAAAIRKSPSHAVFPKLNWSAPRDAAWVATGSTLRCVEPNDVLLLLKSSNFVAHELISPYDGCTDPAHRSGLPQNYSLILRPWVDGLIPSLEFRCFAHTGKLLAISQRDSSNRYKYLDLIKDEIRRVIQCFFDTHLAHSKFMESCFVFDVYLRKAPQVNDSTVITSRTIDNLVLLVDINPFARSTDPLLFTWEEICELSVIQDNDQVTEHDLPLIRITQAQTQHTEFSFNRVPCDVVDVGNGEAIAKFVEECRSGKVEVARR